MTTYISLLRGINVSGRNLVRMDALRLMYENSGFFNVSTYVQSGNVVFQGDDFNLNDLEQKISGQIEKDFGLKVPVIILTIDRLKQTIENNPFLNDKEPSNTYVTFLFSEPGQYDKAAIESKKQDDEEIMFSENAVYLYCPGGYGKTKLTNNFLESRLGVVATTRNWKTTNELFKIAQQKNMDQGGSAN